MHSRHVIEFFSILLQDKEHINYDARKRNPALEQNRQFAINELKNMSKTIERLGECVDEWDKYDKPLKLSSDYLPDTHVETSFLRELLYTTEHCVHHLALIRVGLYALGKCDILDKNFGVAQSTLNYRRSS